MLEAYIEQELAVKFVAIDVGREIRSYGWNFTYHGVNCRDRQFLESWSVHCDDFMILEDFGFS